MGSKKLPPFKPQVVNQREQGTHLFCYLKEKSGKTREVDRLYYYAYMFRENGASARTNYLQDALP